MSITKLWRGMWARPRADGLPHVPPVSSDGVLPVAPETPNIVSAAAQAEAEQLPAQEVAAAPSDAPGLGDSGARTAGAIGDAAAGGPQASGSCPPSGTGDVASPRAAAAPPPVSGSALVGMSGGHLEVMCSAHNTLASARSTPARAPAAWRTGEEGLDEAESACHINQGYSW